MALGGLEISSNRGRSGGDVCPVPAWVALVGRVDHRARRHGSRWDDQICPATEVQSGSLTGHDGYRPRVLRDNQGQRVGGVLTGTAASGDHGRGECYHQEYGANSNGVTPGVPHDHKVLPKCVGFWPTRAWLIVGLPDSRDVSALGK